MATLLKKVTMVPGQYDAIHHWWESRGWTWEGTKLSGPHQDTPVATFSKEVPNASNAETS